MGLLNLTQDIDNIYFDEERIKILTKNWTWDETHLLTDFDKTLTKGNSKTSWSLLMRSGLMPEEYSKKRMEYFDIYHPIEINYELPLEERKEKMNEWWMKHLNLFIEFKLRESLIEQIVSDPDLMSFRDGAKEFLKLCKTRKIPIIIISAGIGNFIEQFLRYNNCLHDNIMIIANFINFENGVAAGFTRNIIHPLNKDEHEVPQKIKEVIQKRPYTLMMGDGIDDIKMILEDNKDKSLKVGFLEKEVDKNLGEYKENFDIVCVNNSSLRNVISVMNEVIK